MSQKQKSILSFFKQAPPSNTNSKKSADNSETKTVSVKKELSDTDHADTKITTLKAVAEDVKKIEKSLNGNSVKEKKPKDAKTSKNNDLTEDSPIKQPKKRKRAAIVESDDESQSSDEQPNKKHDSSEKMNGNHSHDDCDDNMSNGTNQSKIDTKKIKLENGTSSNHSNSTAQQEEPMEEDQPNKADVESKDEDQKELNNADSNLPEIVPKRKTARKQMRGGHIKKEILKERSPQKSSPVKKEPTNIENGVKSPKLEAENTREETSGDRNESDSCNSSPDNSKNEDKTKETQSEKKKIEKESSESDNDQVPVENEKLSSSEEINSENENEESPKQNAKEKSSKAKAKKESPKTKTKGKSSKAKGKNKSSKVKTEEESPKSKTEDKNTKIHPFFGKNKNEETTEESQLETKEKTDKKETKASTSTGTPYDPSKNRYHPIEDACWKRNEKVPYLALAKTLDLIENISGRLKMIEILSNYFRSVIVLTPEDLLQSVYLCLNRLAPEHEGIELGIGELLLMKALAQATGRTTDKIKDEVKLKGDLGLVAESSRGNQRLMFAPPKLTVSSVFSKFKEIAMMTGNTVMSKKVDKIQALFVACRECEAKYIIRSLSGKLRIGLAEQSVLAALSRAAVLTPPNQSYPPEKIDTSSKMGAEAFKEHLNAQTLILKTTYCECPNYDLVIPVLLKEGIAGLPEHCQLTAGFPLKPMLAHPTNGIDEVLNRFDKNEFTCEFKYDGERAQIHRTENGEIKIYSRNQEDNTSKYPDVISRLPKALKETTKSFILDTEAVAWDTETKQILPFQVLSTRKKKDAVESDIVVQVCIMAFDLIYLNGESLVKKPLKDRRELLHSAFTEVENEFMFAIYRDGDSAETMQEFLDESIKGNCEGLMIKALTVDASYEIAKRSHNWLKLKKDYLTGVGDTLDLVVIGGYHGKGKRAGNYGGFLLACYDEDNEEFQSICKLGTGFSDTDLENHTKFFKEHVIKEPRSYYRFDSSLEPDVWFDAVQIWEIKCADLSISPIHKAAIGIVDPEKGISLRFPRFLRIRDDKTKPEDATNSSQIAEMYQKQDQIQNAKKDVKNEEDYY
ncbi:hypothetical protein JTE90_008077 [Oedothorax gibbosus]|uniref:DNA ligase n=1 Tax=Oedothorax gibbosus TaxID=931172 RepID=A0AAV6UVM4_9ARAC|nr:hypothetical protein JTE90_008077 [Oedothorax gibbosus]